jgi:hypothetical protein
MTAWSYVQRIIRSRHPIGWDPAKRLSKTPVQRLLERTSNITMGVLRTAMRWRRQDGVPTGELYRLDIPMWLNRLTSAHSGVRDLPDMAVPW